MLRFIFSTGILLCLCACNSRNSGDAITPLKKEKSIDIYPDSSFFSDVRCMQYYNDSIFLLDVKRRDIVALDSDLDGMRIIGSPGPGPSEFTIPFSFYIMQDTLYLLDAGSGSLKLFYHNELVGNYKLDKALDERFVKIGSQFYIPCVADSSTIVRMSILKGEATPVFSPMGQLRQFKYAKQTYIRNNHIILSDDVFLYAISDNLHIVEKYNPRTMELIEVYDYSELSFVQNNIRYIESKNQGSDNSYYVTVNDACFQNEKLYILYATFEPTYKVNLLLEMDTTPRMAVSHIYQLPGNFYDCFCVSPQKDLYVFGDKSTLEKIQL